jgi:hypothetical protein
MQPVDRYMDCASISSEAQINGVKAQQLGSEQGAKVAQNVAAGVVGALIFWPALFAMDFQGTSDIEMTALQNRQQYLIAMAGQRHCA